MTRESALLLVEERNNVLIIKLNRPKVNAFDIDLIKDVSATFRQAEHDNHVRCVLLTGKGEVFSAGQDIRSFYKTEDVSIRSHLLQTYNPLILQMRKLEKPIVAAINGIVSGAALGIALACDLRIAAENAHFSVGFGRIGLAPDSAVSLLLPMLIGLGRATEFTFSNDPITAYQALAWGLVNRVVPDNELFGAALAWAKSLSVGSLHAMGLAKRAFNKAILANLEQVLDYEAHLQEIAGHTSDHKEGIKAFLEKRPPRFLTSENSK